MKNKILTLFLAFLPFLLVPSLGQTCPFCSENVAKNGGGWSIGIVLTIFFLIGMMGALVSGVAYLIVREGKKSDARHALAQESGPNS